ncbi:DnaJ homolog subfamily B member 4-like protein, partial [Drosera capensis]
TTTRNGESGGGGGGMRKGETVEKELSCSLEELYKGSKRNMKISRTITDYSGNVRTKVEILSIEIKPGWKKGTKVTFPEKGNEEPGVITADIVFVIDEKPHPVFRRDGNDLLVDLEITLLESLTGKTFEITTLDGRCLPLEITSIIKPGFELVVPDEGMPISKQPGKKGSLKFRFKVKYPSRLSEEQKAALRRVLG